MKFLKNIFTFLIPLLSMLITFSIYLLIDNIVNNYKIKISRDYTIVIVTNTPLINDDIKELGGIAVEKIEPIENKKIIESMKSNLSSSSIELLKQKLPSFYQIYLEVFPTSSELERIKETLLKDKNIKKVEVFYKNHNQIFLLLVLLNSVSFILFSIITIFAIIIISKQIKLWFHEHSTRIDILRLHGASILYSASNILSYAIVSSFIAAFMASGFLFYVSTNVSSIFPMELHDIVNVEINIFVEIFKIFLLSLSISGFTIFGVLLKYKISND